MKKRTTTRPVPQNPATSTQTVRVDYWHPTATEVCIAGTFNEWHPNVTPMVSLGSGHWCKELVLPPGRHEYRLLVDGEWVTDPAATETVPNSYGSQNGVLVVQP